MAARHSDITDDDERAGWDGLPPLIVEMAEVAGLAAALDIARERGGNRIYIPAKAADEHWLVMLVGRVAADQLIAHFAPNAGVELNLPRGPTGLRADTWRRMHKMIREGASSVEITRALGISRETVMRHRAKLRDADQLSLFDDDFAEEAVP